MNGKLSVGSDLIGLAQERRQRRTRSFPLSGARKSPTHSTLILHSAGPVTCRPTIQSHPVQSNPIQFNPVQSNSIQSKRPLYSRCLPGTSLRPLAISHRPGICFPSSLHEPFPKETAFELCLASPLQPYLGIEPWKDEPDGTAPAHCGAGQDALDQLSLSC
jgi:hypothetical protein